MKIYRDTASETTDFRKRKFVLGLPAAFLLLDASQANAVVGWDDVALAAASALVGYLTRQGKQSAGMTKDELEQALNSHFEDMKLFTQHIVHKEIVDAETRDIISHCVNVQEDFDSYERHLKVNLRRDAISDLHDAGVVNSYALTKSQTLGTDGLPSYNGLPGYVVSGSQRIMLIAAEANIKQKPELLRDFCKSKLVGEQIPYLKNTLDAYMAALSPEKRLGPIKCSRPRPDDDWRGGSWRPDAEFYIEIDGWDKRTLLIDKIENADDWDVLKGLAVRNLSGPRAELVDFQSRAVIQIQKPIELIVECWGNIANNHI